MIWKTFLPYIILACSVLSATIGYILWSRPHSNRFSNRLLASLLFVYAYINFVTSLIMNGAIVNVPHLFRTAAPLNYLIGPLVFLYVRSSLLSSRKLNYRYLWLFLPAVLNVIELVPFYAQSAAFKVARIQELASNSVIMIKASMFSPWMHLVVCAVLNMGYALGAGQMLWLYRKREQKSAFDNVIYTNWLTTLVVVNIVANVVLMIAVPFLLKTTYANTGFLLITTLAELTICFYIIQRPALLYGAYWLNGRPTSNEIPDVRPDVIPEKPPVPVNPSSDELEVLIQSKLDDTLLVGRKLSLESEPDVQYKLAQLEEYMRNRQPYLQPRLSLAEVAVATELPPYLISAMLNQVQGLDFRDYVNWHRVRYVCELVQSGQYDHLTLEGVGQMAGFSSKTTFYRAFQKHMGLPPSRYFTQKADK